MDQAVNAFFDFYEYTEVSEVTNFSSVARTYRETFFDIFPWIRFQLFDTQRHLTFFTIQCQDNSFHFVTNLHEVLSRTQVLSPRHFRNVDQAFYARSDFDECTVVSHNDNFTLNFVTNFQVWIQRIPWMRSQLFQT